MKGAIYCRVSTEDQEKEGTSLETQLEACLSKARELGYETSDKYTIREVYSGLILDRPKLTELRRWVRDKEVDAIIAYTLDRLSRDPVHLIILEDELERAGITFVVVTETVDSSDLGKLITHIKGFAAKLEVEKIKERTMRGKRARVEKYGKLPSGRGILYGYDYDKEKGLNMANSCLDTVRMVGMWLLNEGIFLNEACRRLMEMGIPAPKGGIRWSRGTLGRIFRNPTYAGKTFAFKTVTVSRGKRVPNACEKQVQIENAVDRAAFSWEEWLGIQKQLDRNRALSPRNQKLCYFLKGIIFCKRDGRKYYGVPMHGKPYYRCSGHSRLLSSQPCNNRIVNAEWLDEMIWKEIEKILLNPQILFAELQRRRELNTDTAHLEQQIKLNQSRLAALDEAETRYLRLYAFAGWSLDRLLHETQRLRQEQRRIEQENAQLEKRIQEAKEVTLSIAGIQQSCELARKNLISFTDGERRMALEALSIKVWVDGDSITIEGLVPVPKADIVSQPV
jgi:site-specific DNA recombinase